MSGSKGNGSRGGRSLGGGSLAQRLHAREDAIAGATTETAILFDANGQLVYEKTGAANEVDTSDLPPSAKGGIFTHNHPSGGSFSLDDVQEAVFWELAEMRAVGQMGGKTVRYSMKPTYADKHTREDVLRIVSEQYRTIHRNVIPITQRLVDEGKMSPERANQEHLHNVWTRVETSIKWRGIALNYTMTTE